MSIPVKINVFEGPMDLLLHLIDINKLNIYDIPIIEITEQYLTYIHQMEAGKMEIMSEFIEMAAILINIKSKMLLPQEKDEDEEKVDPRQELIERLIEYRKFKLIAASLKGLQEDAEKVVFKGPSIPEEIASYLPKADPKQLLNNLELSKLYEIFNSVMKKKIDKIDPIRSRFGEIKKEEFTVYDKIEEIKAYSSKCNRLSFMELMDEQPSKVAIIVTFLAILELMKTGAISIIQELVFDDIIIQFCS